MLKLAAALVMGGIGFWAIERFAMQDGRLLGKFEFEVDETGKPKLLSPGYILTGGAVVIAAVGTGMLVHKITGGRVPSGVSLSK